MKHLFTFLLIALLCASSAFAQRMYDGSGRQVGRVDGERYYDGSGHKLIPTLFFDLPKITNTQGLWGL